MEVVHPSVAVMPVTFPVGERCLRRTTDELASTISEDCRIATSHVKRPRNRRLPLDQAQCSRVLEDPILESRCLENLVRIRVRRAGLAHRQLRRRRKTKKIRKLRRMLSGKSETLKVEEDINGRLVLLQALTPESQPIPLLLLLRLLPRSSSQRSANDRSRLLEKRRRKAREQSHEPLTSHFFSHDVPSARKVAAIYSVHPPGPHPLRARSHMKHASLFN